MSGAKEGNASALRGARLVEAAWTRVAESYRAYWSPRFRPYLESALGSFRPAPSGPMAVPGCGPGDEALLLAARFPDRAIIATDPSAGMLSLLWSALRERGTSNVLASIGSAEELSGSVRQAAGIFSAFTLQLLADPVAALADWSASLREDGAITAVFWPLPDPAAPAGRIRAAVEAVTGEKRQDWEARALAALAGIGLRLAGDEIVRHEMEHASPEDYFEAIVEAGPLQPLKLKVGDQVLARIRAAWLADHGLAHRGGRWVDAPPARLWTIERTGGYEPEH